MTTLISIVCFVFLLEYLNVLRRDHAKKSHFRLISPDGMLCLNSFEIKGQT